MLDTEKIGAFIAEKRRQHGMTQQQLAGRLNISFQAVSKWENGTACPNIELLAELAAVLGVTADELLAGRERAEEGLSYSRAGVDIAYTDAMKREMADVLERGDRRVLNGLGAFASLYDIDFPDMKHPVLVLKSEEPGSKQKLAVGYGYTESICHDMINHLVNDIIVMGAKPLAVLDTIVCGNAEKDTIHALVKGISDACRGNECSLVGGETSIQPQVVNAGTYVLTASIAGIVEKERIIDGSAVREGDVVLAAASNGLHTNGYSLFRLMMERMPQIKLERIEGLTFIEQIKKPHTPYYKAVKEAVERKLLHAMAHITGGGIAGNLCRVIPDGLTARIDLSRLRIPAIFRYIREQGGIREDEMLRTFNCGAGLVLVTGREHAEAVKRLVSRQCDCYEIGEIVSGQERVRMEGRMSW